MSGRHLVVARSAFVVLSAALLAATCSASNSDRAPRHAPEMRAPAPAPGFDGKEIHLGIVSPRTGLSADIGAAISTGNRLYWDNVNAQGGIAGKYRVQLIAIDAQDFESVAVQGFDAVQSGVVLFNQIYGTRAIRAILPRLRMLGMIAAPATFDDDWIREPNLLPVGAPSDLQAINAIAYVAQHAGGERQPLCVLREDDTYGRWGDDGIKFASRSLGVPVVADLTFEPIATDFHEQLDALTAAHCRIVIYSGLPFHTQGLMSQAVRQRFAPRWIGLARGWRASFATDPAIRSYLEAHFWLASEGPTWGDTSVPGMAKLVDAARRANVMPDANVMFGYIQSMAVRRVLERAVAHRDLSRASVLNATGELGRVSFEGLVGDYSYGVRAIDRDPPRATTIFAVDPSAPGGLVVRDRVASETARKFPVG